VRIPMDIDRRLEEKLATTNPQWDYCSWKKRSLPSFMISINRKRRYGMRRNHHDANDVVNSATYRRALAFDHSRPCDALCAHRRRIRLNLTLFVLRLHRPSFPSSPSALRAPRAPHLELCCRHHANCPPSLCASSRYLSARVTHVVLDAPQVDPCSGPYCHRRRGLPHIASLDPHFVRYFVVLSFLSFPLYWCA